MYESDGDNAIDVSKRTIATIIDRTVCHPRSGGVQVKPRPAPAHSPPCQKDPTINVAISHTVISLLT